jgi:hypothetical protein
MMTRRELLRNILLGIATTLVPKILQPTVPEIINEPGYKGILWEIRNATIVDYRASDFKISDIDKYLQ